MSTQTQYPPSPSDVARTDRAYQDAAAVALYGESGASRLVAASARISNALVEQAKKLETFHSTPFTEQNVATIRVTLEALERTQRALDEWHWLIYPNQRPA